MGQSVQIIRVWTLLSAVGFGLGACKPRSFNSEVRKAKMPLEKTELVDLNLQGLSSPTSLDREFFQKTSPEIKPEDFETKWNIAREEGALKFLRSFVTSYYTDLKKIRTGAGPIGVCFGDPHIENFGFVVFQEEARYVYNDFDDSGYCPVGLDILRYLTSVRLFEKDDSVAAARLAHVYAKIISAGAEPEVLSKNYSFKSADKRKKNIHKYINNKRFIVREELEPVPESDKKILVDAFKQDSSLQNYSVVDAVSTSKDSGGSAGLKRYWVYAQGRANTPDEDILECKLLIAPGTAAGEWGKLPPDRMEFLKREIWSGLEPRDHIEVDIGKAKFMVRSRTKGTIDLADLGNKERLKLYTAQIGIIAAHHRKYWKNTAGLEDWLVRNTDFLAERYKLALEASMVPAGNGANK